MRTSGEGKSSESIIRTNRHTAFRLWWLMMKKQQKMPQYLLCDRCIRQTAEREVNKKMLDIKNHKWPLAVFCEERIQSRVTLIFRIFWLCRICGLFYCFFMAAQLFRSGRSMKKRASPCGHPNISIISYYGPVCKPVCEYFLNFCLLHKKLLCSFADLSIDFRIFLWYNVITKKERDKPMYNWCTGLLPKASNCI